MEGQKQLQKQLQQKTTLCFGDFSLGSPLTFYKDILQKGIYSWLEKIKEWQNCHFPWHLLSMVN